MFKSEVYKVWGDPTGLTCPYVQYGCKNKTLCDNYSINEQICPFRTISCPNCHWRGPANSFKGHIMENHDYDWRNINLVLDGSGARIIKNDGDFYVLWYTYDECSGEAKFGLRFVGPLQHSKRRFYKLRVKDRYGEAEYSKQVANCVNLSKDSFYTVDINLHDFKKPETYKDKMELELCVIVEYRIPTFPGDIREFLLTVLTCGMCGRLKKGPMFQQGVAGSSDLCEDCNTKDISQMRNLAIENLRNLFIDTKQKFDDRLLLYSLKCRDCSEYMSPPIKNCVNGHNICGSCRSSLSSCSICKRPFSGIRNFSLETIYNKMQYKCINSKFGCTYTNFANMLHFHENYCPL